jgi:hypothetical protein
MANDQSRSESSAAVVIIVVLLLLFVPCLAGLLFGGFRFFASLQAPRPIPLPPVPGANAPPPVPMPPGVKLPGGLAIPDNASITVNNLKSSQNLFGDAEKILTLAKYDEIKPGMTYEKLLSLLEIPENKRPADIELVGPESDVELKWFGGAGDALSITVKMKGKVVVDKTQSGLK